MCTDPDSPSPGAFCCMRGWAITAIVFGVFELLGSWNYISGSLGPTPCYGCPSGSMNAITIAGYNCMDGGTWKGGSQCADQDYWDAFCDDTPGAVTTQADCAYLWESTTCSENAGFWANSELFQHSVVGGTEECDVVQATFAAAGCCATGGTAPPTDGGSGMILGVLAILLGLLRVTSGSLLSCCGGRPTSRKLMIALVLQILVMLLDVVFAIMLLVGL